MTTDRPKITEFTLGKSVREVLNARTMPNSARAWAAVILIRARVEAAYGITA